MKLTVRMAIVLSVSLVALSGCLDPARKGSSQRPKPTTPADITVGMSSETFALIFPGARIPANGQWTRPDEIHGLRGEWTYSFYRHRLSWFVFNSYEPDVSAFLFEQYLAATRLTVADYTERYGKPELLMRGVLEYKDPTQGYPGYPVLRASWTIGSENLRVNYSVLGNAHENPQLLFTVEVRRQTL